MAKSVFTSESVSMGHPDKLADQISDAVLDAFISGDPVSRVACETLVKTGFVVVAGEVTSQATVDIQAKVREAILDVGYDDASSGIDGASCGVLVALEEQSRDISQGVSEGEEGSRTARPQCQAPGRVTSTTSLPITISSPCFSLWLWIRTPFA